MTTKLTLSIDTETIKKAKQISHKRGTSISRLVEEFLLSLTDTNEKQESAVLQLRGIGGNSSKQLNWKKIKTNKLRQKYGV